MSTITPEQIEQISKLVDNWKLSAADFQLKMVSMVASAILVEPIINDFKVTNDIKQSVKTVLDVYSETVRSLNARLSVNITHDHQEKV